MSKNDNQSNIPSKPRTINIVTAALGGEGGGVFTSWLIDVAEANGWMSQTTSLAGVAQRTGATIYYIELFPRDQASKQQPVMSLFPAQGDIDIAVSSEIAEAGRMLQRGFITPERTTLISSTHRVFGITEKADLGDGVINSDEILKLGEKYSKSFVRFDMQDLAKRNNSVISSGLLGALAGSGALPFTKESYEQVIRNTGKAVETNLACFNASYNSAIALSANEEDVKVEYFDPAKVSKEFILPRGTTIQGQALLDRLVFKLPKSVHEIAYQGLKKTLDYQDYRYAEQYLDELERFIALDTGANDYELLQTLARYLALWMCFEDISRVAQLKIRDSRMDEIREEVKAMPGQIFHVTEFFKPRVEEMCAMLPASIGSWALDSKFCRATLNLFSGGKKLRTNSLPIYFSLRFLSFLRKFRRSTLGYQHEYGMISSWLSAIETVAKENPATALELARCGRIVKGYGDTRARTSTQLMSIVSLSKTQTLDNSVISELHRAALSGDDNREFETVLKASA